MRPFFLWLLFQLFMPRLWAQLTIKPGAQFYLSGSGVLTLHNMSLVNDGTFSAGTSEVTFSGTQPTAISGSQAISFHRINLNKYGGTLLLQRPVSVNNRLLFNSGMLELGRFDLDLGTTGWLDSEREESRLFSLDTGKVRHSALLNAPAGVNPGNLGAVFSSSENLGTVSIARGHLVQVTANGTPATVKRVYDIVSSSGAATSTLRLSYFDAELNGALEHSMFLYSSPDASSWFAEAVSGRNGVENFLEATSTLSRKRWVIVGTHPPAAQPLPTGVAPRHNAGSQSIPLISYAAPTPPATARSRSTVQFWPNPSSGVFFLRLSADEPANASIHVYDGKGALVKKEQAPLQHGSNQLTLNISALPIGPYTIQVSWDNGMRQKAITVLKK